MKKNKNFFIKHFVEGLLVIMPFVLTAFIIFYCLKKIHDILIFVANYIPGLGKLSHIPGLSLVIVLFMVGLMGFLASSFIVKTFFSLLERLVMKIPVINILFSYIKEYTAAFVDKLDKPVWIISNKELNIKRVGFITQENLKNLGLSEEVAVYLPHSFSFSGELQIVPSFQVKKIDAPRSAVLKFILSGGLSNIERPLEKVKAPKK